MIKKSLYLLPFIVSAFANAENGVYTSLYSGATFSSKSKTTADSITDTVKLKTAPVFGAAVGYNYQDVSFELSYDTRSSKANDDSGSKMKSNILLANLVYNFNIASENIKPYVGIGAGFAQSQLTFSDTDASSLGVNATQKLKNAFALQLKGGAKVYLTQNVAVFGDLRYTNLAKANYKTDELKTAFGVNELKGSLNYFSANVGVSYFF
jgi:opacity protein-like surface antigen